ncbi:hypothetical protein OFC17_36735, partial [Escherichia coli]|nr:hypothetical protein [Escherichia coli]
PQLLMQLAASCSARALHFSSPPAPRQSREGEANEASARLRPPSFALPQYLVANRMRRSVYLACARPHLRCRNTL